MAKILSGKEISEKIMSELREEVAKIKKDRDVTPGLAVLLVGNDPASKVYVANKEKACKYLEIYSEKYESIANIEPNDVINLIYNLNQRETIHGILVQLPLPAHIDPATVIKTISPEKDVDCFHEYNLGKLLAGDPLVLPCTAIGIVELLKQYKVKLSGKHCVVIGRSAIVGKPTALLLLEEDATVTICHSKTENIEKITREADIIIVAVGCPYFVTESMVKKGVVLVDVGMNRLPNGKIVGDSDYDGISKIAAAITPVPGGVGLMTITMLMKNTIIATKNLIEK